MKLNRLVMPTTTVAAMALATTILSSPSSVLADENLEDQLQQCASIDDASLRLACYDELGGREAMPSVAAPAAAPAAAPVAAQPVTTPQTESVQGGLPDWEEDNSVAVNVTRCTQDPHKKYLFYLEDGQVWKQISSKRLFFRDCKLGATIRKDIFGYKIQFDGDKSSVRISRLR